MIQLNHPVCFGVLEVKNVQYMEVRCSIKGFENMCIRKKNTRKNYEDKQGHFLEE